MPTPAKYKCLTLDEVHAIQLNLASLKGHFLSSAANEEALRLIADTCMIVDPIIDNALASAEEHGVTV